MNLKMFCSFNGIPHFSKTYLRYLFKIEELEKFKGFNLSNYNGIDKIKILRNCVEPEIALRIFKMAFKDKQTKL
ncbi:hypothetical protein LCGC14_0477990 [marine sediment metagenome]|uniref:Uncharacterized protein n=1 Tax=marine sediment metagenome TaxID=412755 RepID=A0A0F9VJ64_9ZZZZ